MRPVIYQLFVRHFSNACTTGVPHGEKWQNGCGTFEGINDAALQSLAEMGVSHLWLTGVLRHATQTGYPSAPASPASVVKGIAGSPYAVVDYYDVDPDLAVDVENRLAEFRALLDRIRAWGMVPMMDFVPNHVSRDYVQSSLSGPENKSCFFARDNFFYYLEPAVEGPPLRLPEGVFLPEAVYGRVTGNNAATWTPSPYDWYETVKLNYGMDYRAGAASAEALPSMMATRDEVPATWRAMDDILAYWQAMGVGGFRCDMAHMVPMPFWRWVIARCRVRDGFCMMMAEGYNDHMRLSVGDVHEALLSAGFDAVYDAKSYESLRHIYESGSWANDLDECHRRIHRPFYAGVRYLENHDEPRVCAPAYWGGVGEKVLPALMMAQYASSQGPVLVYNGQEFGERAEGPAGYGGDNGRSSIFDYTCLPRLQQWLDKGAYHEDLLSAPIKEQRRWMSCLLRLLQHPALSQGEFYGLNWSNRGEPDFGRLEGENVSGHYTYAFLRHHKLTKSTVLALCNLSPTRGEDHLHVRIPLEAQAWCAKRGARFLFTDLLSPQPQPQTMEIDAPTLAEQGLSWPLDAGQAALLSWSVLDV